MRYFLMIFLILTGCALNRILKPRLKPPHKVNGGYIFQFYAPYARMVNLAGDFNGWCGTVSGPFNPEIGKMYDDGTHGDKKAGDGIWTIIVNLKPGVYKYKFVVDGMYWYTDPSNPETITEGGYTNSVVRVK